MAATNRVPIHLRLEDLVALTFFLLTAGMRIFVKGLRSEFFSPADVLVIFPAMTILLAKEFIHYFWMGSRAGAAASAAGPKGFVRPYWVIVRDWSPFLVILLMYYSLWGDATHLLVTRDMDAELIALDQRLFGMQASVAMQAWITPALTSWMQFAYFFHVLNGPLVALFVYLFRARERFREMMTGVIVVTFFGLLGYLLVPAIGPMYTLSDQYTVPLAEPLEVMRRQMEFMDFARIRRDVFPSLHVGLSLVVWLYAYRNSRRLFWVLAPLMLSLFVSTVYLRYHYLIDVVAGLILAPLCFVLTNWLFRRCADVRVLLPVPGAWAPKSRAPSDGGGAA
jgi:membrane-associated phospholipid phosphatase